MKEITRLYALEWYGPYDSIEEMWEDYDTEQCSIYLITGKEKYERGAEHIKYVGITERDPCKRLTDHDHQEKQAKIQYKKYWVGRFSRSSNKNSRAHAELIESLYIRYLYLQEIRIINDKKLKRAPRYPPLPYLIDGFAGLPRGIESISQQGYLISQMLCFLMDANIGDQTS